MVNRFLRGTGLGERLRILLPSLPAASAEELPRARSPAPPQHSRHSLRSRPCEPRQLAVLGGGSVCHQRRAGGPARPAFPPWNRFGDAAGVCRLPSDCGGISLEDSSRRLAASWLALGARLSPRPSRSPGRKIQHFPTAVRCHVF